MDTLKLVVDSNWLVFGILNSGLLRNAISNTLPLKEIAKHIVEVLGTAFRYSSRLSSVLRVDFLLTKYSTADRRRHTYENP